VKKTTVLMAAVLAAVLTVGLTVLLTSIQEAQANPCANEISRGGSADNAFIPQNDDELECDFTGYFDFEEEIDSEDIPPTPTGAFTVSTLGSGVNSYICDGLTSDGLVIVDISAQGQEDGTVTGFVRVQTPEGGDATYPVSGGTTDGNTFSLSGEISQDELCGTPGIPDQFTVSGDCGNSVLVKYEESDSSATVTGDVECTLL
jgi:hypothetical protein